MTSSDPDIKRLEARLDGIAHVLRDRRLRVPQYQRSYAWDSEEVDTFWSDLRAALMSSTPSYFLGTLVLSSEAGSRESAVIDGQQRLATAAILLAAIRDEFNAVGDASRADALQSEFLTFNDIKLGRPMPRLKLNTRDAQFFEDLVIGGGPPIEPETPSARRLNDAYRFLRGKIHEEAEAAKSGWKDRLIRWTEFLEYDVQTIVVTVPTPADAFLIFETLNDRGVALSVADLLKSYLYSVAGDRVSEVTSAWETTLSTLESPQHEQQLLDFLRQYWSSWYGAVRERDLYRSFRLRVKSEAQSTELAARLAQASPNFLALTTGDATLWPPDSIDQQEAETLHALQLTQYRPLLLAAMDHLPPKELKRLVRATVSWLVRGIVVGGIGGGMTERYFCDAAMRVRAGDAPTAEKVLEALKDIVPTDEQFRAAARTLRTPRAHLTRYLLLAWEQFRDDQDQARFVTLQRLSQCYPQSVLPRNPGPTWASFQEADAATWSRRFGNWVLVDRRPLPSTRTWDDVKQVLAGSRYTGAQEAARHKQWTIKSIEKRQEQFAEAAPEIWPRDP